MGEWVEWFRQRRSRIRPEFKREAMSYASVSMHLPLGQVLGGGLLTGAVAWLIAGLILSYFNVHDAID